MIKISKRIIGMMSLACTLVFMTGCQKPSTMEAISKQDLEGNTTNTNKLDIARLEKDYSELNTNPPSKPELILISKSRIMAWWWHKHVAMRVDVDNPPPKENYIELRKWEYDGETIKPYPRFLDFETDVVNRSKRQFSGTIEFAVTSRYGDYEAINYDSTKQCEEYPWQKDSKIFKKKLVLEPLGVKFFKKKNFDFSPLLQAKFNNNSICSLRFTVIIFDSNGIEISRKSLIIPVLQGD